MCPHTLALQAAAHFPDDVNAALDWVSATGRRHQFPRLLASSGSRDVTSDVVSAQSFDLCTPPSPEGRGLSPRSLPAPSSGGLNLGMALPIPSSWVPRPLLSTAEKASRYWTCVRDDVHRAAEVLYQKELLWAQTDADAAARLLDGFLALPAQPPQHYSQFGLTFEDLYNEEIRLLHLRTTELHEHQGTVEHACASHLDVVGLCPFPLAVAAVLSSAADIAPEFIVAFFYSLAGWVCHHDIHAVFDPVKRDRRTRPRCMVQCICDSAAGKSPFWRGFVSPGLQVLMLRSQFSPHILACGPMVEGKDST